MDTNKEATKVLAMFLYSEGMGQVSDITDSTFWIEGKRKNKVETHFTSLSSEIDFSDCCLCADFVLLALFDKTGDNVILMKTEKLKGKMTDGKAKLVDIAEVIVYRWAVEFLADPNV